MSKKVFPVIHFELPAEDPKRARGFYEGVFGWQITSLGPELGDFHLAFTTETDPETRMPKRLGAINGGLYPKAEPDQHTNITILVDDIREVLKEVEAAGGRVQGDLADIPDVGLFANFTDTEGNLVTLYEDHSPHPTPEQQALLDPQPPGNAGGPEGRDGPQYRHS